MEETRLGIPILFAEECPHGHMAIGATVSPTGLSMASTWDKKLLYQVGQVVALEARLQGANIGYGPVLGIASEPHWSRMEETFGKDPILTALLGTSYMKGMQGKQPNDGKHLYSTLKHFAAYGIPEEGHNGNQATVGTHQLFSDYLYPFKKAVEAGVATIMTSYNTIDRIPCTSNKYLLTEDLRNEWGFKGFVYSDLFSIDGIAESAHVAKDIKEAGKLALEAGVDMDLGANTYGEHTLELLKEKRLDIHYVDRAVANTLRLKFRMGLFENPYVSPETAEKLVRSAKHKLLAKQVAREGIVLLKNDGILPLKKNIKDIAVIGPNANTMYNQLGDYTAPQDDKEFNTPLEGIQAKVSANSTLHYVKGCAIRDITNSDIPAAVRAAKTSDVVILVVGGSSARDFKTEYISTEAATVSSNKGQILTDMDCGEGYDRRTLNLLGDQEKLMQALIETKKPLIVVYIQGRTLNMNLATDKANTLLSAWYPGEEDGNVLADIIFGDYNPSGRLPVSVRLNEGQLPVYYSQGNPKVYLNGEENALYSYSNLEILPSKEKGVLLTVRCTITNNGPYDGHEVVQLYIRDEVASVSQAPISLKAFERIFVPKGKSKYVEFKLRKDDLSLYTIEMKEVVEPGDFKVMIGVSSSDIRLSGTFHY